MGHGTQYMIVNTSHMVITRNPVMSRLMELSRLNVIFLRNNCTRESIVVFIHVDLLTNLKFVKGLIIFNAAAGGWSTGEGGQNFFETCLRGDEKIAHSI